MAVWTFTHGPWTGLPTAGLPTITGRTATWRLVGNSEAAFTIDGTLPETARIQELISDLWVLRNGVPYFRGRVGATSDNLDGTSHQVTFNAADYRAVLRRRILFDADTLTYPSQDIALTAWSLINQTQGKPGGSLGITRGVGQTAGSSQAPTFTAGSSVGDMVDQLGQGVPGFDWDINPTGTASTLSTGLTFDTYSPRGQDRQTVLDYGGRVASLTRNVDPGVFANALRVTGGSPPTGTAPAPVAVTESGIATDPAGRFEAQYGDTTVVTTAALQARASYQLAAQQNVAPVYTVTLNPNTWSGKDDLWLGDPIILKVNSGRLAVVASLRVFEIKLTLDDAGDTEKVDVTLGAAPSDRRWLLRRFDARLTALEKR